MMTTMVMNDLQLLTYQIHVFPKDASALNFYQRVIYSSNEDDENEELQLQKRVKECLMDDRIP